MRGDQEPRETIRLGIAVCVAALWLLANGIQTLDNTREAPLYVNLMFAAIVGWFFGSWIGERRKRNGGDDDAS